MNKRDASWALAYNEEVFKGKLHKAILDRSITCDHGPQPKNHSKTIAKPLKSTKKTKKSTPPWENQSKTMKGTKKTKKQKHRFHRDQVEAEVLLISVKSMVFWILFVPFMVLLWFSHGGVVFLVFLVPFNGFAMFLIPRTSRRKWRSEPRLRSHFHTRQDEVSLGEIHSKHRFGISKLAAYWCFIALKKHTPHNYNFYIYIYG